MSARDGVDLASDAQLLWCTVLLVHGRTAFRRGSGSCHLRARSRGRYQDIVGPCRMIHREVELIHSSPDLIVHGILDAKRPLDDIRTDLKSIMERLVSYGLALARWSKELMRSTSLSSAQDSVGTNTCNPAPGLLSSWRGSTIRWAWWLMPTDYGWSRWVRSQAAASDSRKAASRLTQS